MFARHPYENQFFDDHHQQPHSSSSSEDNSNDYNISISDTVVGGPLSPAESPRVDKVKIDALAYGDDGNTVDRCKSKNPSQPALWPTNPTPRLQALPTKLEGVSKRSDPSKIKSSAEELKKVVEENLKEISEISYTLDCSEMAQTSLAELVKDEAAKETIIEVAGDSWEAAACRSCQVETSGSGQVETSGSGQVETSKSGQIETNKSCQVETSRSGQVETSESSQVEVSKSCQVEISENCQIDNSETWLVETSETSQSSVESFEEQSELATFKAPANVPQSSLSSSKTPTFPPRSMPPLPSNKRKEPVSLSTEYETITTETAVTDPNTETDGDASWIQNSERSKSPQRDEIMQTESFYESEEEVISRRSAQTSIGKSLQTSSESEEFTRITDEENSTTERDTTDNDTGPTEYRQSKFIKRTEQESEEESIDSTLKCGSESFDNTPNPNSRHKAIKNKSIGAQANTEGSETFTEWKDNTDQHSVSSSSVGTQTRRFSDQHSVSRFSVGTQTSKVSDQPSVSSSSVGTQTKKVPDQHSVSSSNAETQTRNASDQRSVSSANAETQTRKVSDPHFVSSANAETQTRKVSDPHFVSSANAETQTRKVSDPHPVSSSSAETQTRKVSDPHLVSSSSAETQTRKVSDQHTVSSSSAETQTRRLSNHSTSTADLDLIQNYLQHDSKKVQTPRPRNFRGTQARAATIIRDDENYALSAIIGTQGYESSANYYAVPEEHHSMETSLSMYTASVQQPHTLPPPVMTEQGPPILYNDYFRFIPAGQVLAKPCCCAVSAIKANLCSEASTSKPEPNYLLLSSSSAHQPPYIVGSLQPRLHHVVPSQPGQYLILPSA
ncbi:serine-rich adhesin for platelets-like [Watersipora subatra]|uniref:serine-rich adhesin for platelets-like n=1 Tax=Watersipora subatra TaxID=2589382 RepID=UPI00355C0ECA